MDVAVELAGEWPTLAVSESLHVAGLGGPAVERHRFVRSLVVGTATPPEVFRDRLALAWGAGAAVAVTDTDPDAVGAVAPAIATGDGTVAVRAKRLDPAAPRDAHVRAERRLGKALAQRARVELDSPDTLVRVLLDRRAIVAAPWLAIDRTRFEARHVRHRPFFAPVTLHPKLARALVNVADVREGHRVWDPFCGTGGVLLEAGLVGGRLLASDLAPRMVGGAHQTLTAAGLKLDGTVVGDVAQAAGSVGPVDVVVTDPPYGKGATLNREPRARLYARFFEAAAGVLRQGAPLVAMLPSRDDAAVAGPAFSLDEVHDLPVHGSMTRHVCRFTRR